MIKHILAVAVLVCLSSNLFAQAAKEAFAISNNTGRTVNYEVKWADGPWKAYSLPTGMKDTHSFTVNAGEKRPQPTLKFNTLNKKFLPETKEYLPDLSPLPNPVYYSFRIVDGFTVDFFIDPPTSNRK